jgi:hypothetical protein
MTACGHTRHVGTCPACQRAQLARWDAQLIAASNAARVSAAPPRSSPIEDMWRTPPEPISLAEIRDANGRRGKRLPTLGRSRPAAVVMPVEKGTTRCGRKADHTGVASPGIGSVKRAGHLQQRQRLDAPSSSNVRYLNGSDVDPADGRS